MIKKIKILRLTKIPLDLDEWVSWLNNKIVTKYSRQRHKNHSSQSQKKFLQKKLKSKRNLIFKIIYKKKFIGVLELSNINYNKKNCELSYMVGSIKNWGKGFATQAINLALIYSKKKLHLKKVYAGTHKRNIPSKKVLLNNNFFIIKKNKTYNFFERIL